eukprot:1650034-Alexandrium_andersonii.AAC.1
MPATQLPRATPRARGVARKICSPRARLSLGSPPPGRPPARAAFPACGPGRGVPTPPKSCSPRA